MCDLSITNPHSQLSQLLRNPSLTEKLPNVRLVHLSAFWGAEAWDNRDGNRQAGNVRATQNMTGWDGKGREGISVVPDAAHQVTLQGDI